MAQSGSAPALGAGCRGFKSLCPDHAINIKKSKTNIAKVTKRNRP